jgi:hypothetical protein
MALSFCMLLLLVVAGQLCLSTGFVVPSTSTAPSASSPARTFLPSSVTAGDTLLSNPRQPNLPFIFTERAELNTQAPVSLPKLHIHVADSELGDVVDIMLEMRELLVPEPSALASMGKLLEVALLQMTN